MLGVLWEGGLLSSRMHALSLVFGGSQSHEVGTGLNSLPTEALSLRSLCITLCSLLNRQERLQETEEHVSHVWNVQKRKASQKRQRKQENKKKCCLLGNLGGKTWEVEQKT